MRPPTSPRLYPRSRPASAPRHRPRLEPLEPRAVPTLGFLPPVFTPLPLPAGSLATGDFNHDHVSDLVVSSGGPAGVAPPGSPGSVSVLLGRRDGTFGPASVVAAGPSPGHVVAADFNRDGDLDFAVDFQPALGAPLVVVLLGRGDGTFRPPVTLPLPTAGDAIRLIAGDFNGDRKPDLAEVVRSFPLPQAPPSGVYLLLGRGDGTFAAPAFTPAPRGDSAAAGDFNGDGRLDVAIAYAGSEFGGAGGLSGPAGGAVVPPGGDGIAVLPGRRGGTFGAPVFTPTSSALDLHGALRPRGARRQDLVAIPRGPFLPGGGGGTGGGLVVIPAVGRGAFGTPVPVAVDPVGQPVDAVAADFNRDHRPDLAVTTASAGESFVFAPVGGVSVIPGLARGRFGGAVAAAGGSLPSLIAVGDFNGDRRPDLVVSNRPPLDLGVSGGLAPAAGGGYGVSVLLNRGGGRGRRG